MASKYKSKIFLVGKEKGSLTALEETHYEAETVLQDLLCDYPDLLPGDQIDPDNPRRWLLVAREMGVPGDVDETGRWSLDHLFLDQEGVPTFVECKRTVDTRARREVVAQMLDYAANGVEYWSVDRLRQTAAETAERQGRTIEGEIARLLDPEEPDIEAYWAHVQENLEKRRVRLLFVTDETPRELRRLVEFLNEEMAHVEVLAVEVKQFRGLADGGHKALVSRVLGFTETARDKKATGHVTAERFLEKCSPIVGRFFSQVWEQAEKRGHTIYWGTVGFSIRAESPTQHRLNSFIYGFPSGDLQFRFLDFTRDWGIDKAVLSDLRKKLLALGVFRESESTLRTTVTEDNAVRMNEVYDCILAEVDKIIKPE